MSLLQKAGVLGVISLLTACAAPAAFPDISDEENGRSTVLTASDGLVSEGALRASEPEKGLDEEELMAAERQAAISAAAEKSAAEDTELMSNDEFLSKAEKLEATQTKPVEKSEVAAVKEQKYEDVFKAARAEKPDSVEEDDNAPSVTYRLETFYFANGSAVLESENMSRIREIVKIAKQNKGKIRVVGYASSRTRNTDIATHKLANFKVSQERADSVAKALRRAGLSANNISVEALSDSNPAYLEVMPEGERLNRRAEVYISY